LELISLKRYWNRRVIMDKKVEAVKETLILMDDEEEPCPPIGECPNKEQMENDDCKKCWATYICQE